MEFIVIRTRVWYNGNGSHPSGAASPEWEWEQNEILDLIQVFKSRNVRRPLLAATVVAFCAFLSPPVLRLLARGQADFAVYYYAGKAWSLGLNPYVNANLTRVAGHPI